MENKDYQVRCRTKIIKLGVELKLSIFDIEQILLTLVEN